MLLRSHNVKKVSPAASFVKTVDTDVRCTRREMSREGRSPVSGAGEGTFDADVLALAPGPCRRRGGARLSGSVARDCPAASSRNGGGYCPKALREHPERADRDFCVYAEGVKDRAGGGWPRPDQGGSQPYVLENEFHGL